MKLETPRNPSIVTTVLAVIVGVVAGILGYAIGRRPTTIIFPPGTVITIPQK